MFKQRGKTLLKAMGYNRWLSLYGGNKKSKIIISNLCKRVSKKIPVHRKHLNHTTVKKTRSITESRLNLEDIKITDNSGPFGVSSHHDNCHACIETAGISKHCPLPQPNTCLCISHLYCLCSVTNHKSQ